MNTVYLRHLAIGEGRPKICVPICGKTKEAILNEAEKILQLGEGAGILKKISEVCLDR